MKLDVITLNGKTEGSITLSKDIFGVEVRKDLLHRASLYQQAKSRAGTADVKNRSEITTTGKKMYRQKGTGGARHGDKGVCQFRGGGVAFGPTPRSFAFSMPKKVRALALKSALSAKMANKEIIVIDEAKTKTHKTKDLVTQLNKLDITNALFVVDSTDVNFDRATKNIPHISVVPTEGVNVYGILRAHKLVITKAAVAMLEAAITKRANGSCSVSDTSKSKEA